MSSDVEKRYANLKQLGAVTSNGSEDSRVHGIRVTERTLLLLHLVCILNMLVNFIHTQQIPLGMLHFSGKKIESEC